MFNNNIEIKDLVPFLEQNLKGYKIVNYNLDYLTKPGDNFGSIMYDLTVTLESTDVAVTAAAEPLADAELNKTIKMKLVAKTPVINPDLVKVFQPELSCIKENGMYHIVCPILQQLQIDANINETDLIDVFVKCYGSRLSLNSDDTQTKADNDAVLLLENLRVKGYQSVDRSKGFDSTFTFKILESLAQFHALPIAVRRLKPDVFENKIMPILFEFNYYEAIDYERLCEQIKQQLKKTGLDDELCEKLNKQYRICEEFIRFNRNGKDTPYSTIVHRDFWVNNLMFLNDADNNLKIKIFDFQLVSYKSLAIDIAFFLFTSVQSNVLEENFEEFLKHYYKHFCNTLKQVGCPVDEYSYDGFHNEFYYYAKLEFSHIILMTRVLMAKTDYDIDINEFSEDDMFDESGLSEEYFNKIKNICILFNKLKIID